MKEAFKNSLLALTFLLVSQTFSAQTKSSSLQVDSLNTVMQNSYNMKTLELEKQKIFDSQIV
jgi:hypothetical protein